MARSYGNQGAPAHRPGQLPEVGSLKSQPRGVDVLHEFLTAHRDELIESCRYKSTLRVASAIKRNPVPPNGVPSILDQLIDTLRAEQAPETRRDILAFDSYGAKKSLQAGINAPAAQYGQALLRNGFPVEEIVYGYGDLCQAVTDLAVKQDAMIEAREFRTLNHCLDQAIAEALISYSARVKTPEAADDAVQRLNERLGYFVHELRNHLQTATLALAASRTENKFSSAANLVLDRSIIAMRNLVRRSLSDVRTTAEVPACRQLVTVADLISDIRQSVSLDTRIRNLDFVVEPVDTSLGICVDAELLSAALGNLLQNAFKFTHRHTQVTLTAFAKGDRVLIEVMDNCGGLPAGDTEDLFRPFTQAGRDKSGAGLGLSICRRNVEANDGVLSVRDIPGTGCVFSIDLPRAALASPELSGKSRAGVG